MAYYHPDLLARPVPRYTSYPTAVDFTEGVGEADFAAALADVAVDAPISVYLHIPYCTQICWYCGCNTGAANRRQRLTAYLDAMHDEIATLSRRLAGRGKVQRIAFGGGSPNAISPVDFVRLVDAVQVQLGGHGAQIDVEIDPRNFTQEWAATLGDAGVTRVSLGVQTFDPAIQAAIGREQPKSLIASCVHGLRAAGVESLNFDLMYGLPGQGTDELAATLDTATALRPDRIALFGYAHLPDMLPRQRRIDARHLPNAEQRFMMADVGREILCAAGYQAVGFDHFALPTDSLAKAARRGELRRNFQGFTDDRADILIGIGASAISMFPGLIVQNEKNAGQYRMLATAGKLPVSRGIVRDADDQLRGRIIEQILCHGTARLETSAMRAIVATRLTSALSRKLVRLDGDMLVLEPDAWPYARTIAAVFDCYREPEQLRFSHAI